MRIVMMGTGSFAEPTMAALLDGAHAVAGLFTQPDRPTGKERGSTRQARRGLKELAEERGIPVLQPESVNTPDGVAALQALRPDLLVVAAYGQILSNEVLGCTTYGGINVHASLLPKYRGAAPINWAIYHGEKQSGVTIIRMSVQLDAGDVLVQEAVDILPDESAGALEARLAPLGARLAMQVVERIALGTPVPGVKQDKSQVTKAPKLTKEHGLIDWARPAEAVANHIRAMQPWPTPYTFLNRPGAPALRLIVLKARAISDGAGHDQPQSGVVRSDAALGRLLVQCGDAGWLDVLELQPAGKRRMTAAEFLRGHTLPPEARMGNAAAE
jgi:methionyl-tRNA formyltransferase